VVSSPQFQVRRLTLTAARRTRVAQLLCFFASSLLPFVAFADTIATNRMRLSLDVAATLLNGGFVDEEVISVGTIAAGALFNATTAGVPNSVEVDAVFVSGGDVVFSTDQNFKVGSSVYADEDLVAYSVTGATLSVYFDGSANGIAAKADLDAASLEINATQTNLLLSLDIATSLPGAGR